MDGGGGPFRPTGGQIILSALLQNGNKSQQQPLPLLQQQSVTMDPAVAAVGPTIPNQSWPSSSSFDHDLFRQGFNQNPRPSPGNNKFPGSTSSQQDAIWGLGSHQNHTPELLFGSFSSEVLNRDGFVNSNRVSDNVVAGNELFNRLKGLSDTGFGLGNGTFTGFDRNPQFELPVMSSNLNSQRIGNNGSSEYDSRGNGGWARREHGVVHRSAHDGGFSKEHGMVHRPSLEIHRTPPGFPSNPQGGRSLDSSNRRSLDSSNRRNYEKNVGVANGGFSELNNRAVTSIVEDQRTRKPSSVNSKAHHYSFLNTGITQQFDRPGPPTGSNHHSVGESGIEESIHDLHVEIDNIENEHKKTETCRDIDGSNDRTDKKKGASSRDKYARSDSRGNWLLSQKMRNVKRQMICRGDIGILNAPFLAIYESLIPAEEEKAKQKQLLALLERLVSNEWPEAQLHLYGSCANSFDVCKSDIDVCLEIDDSEINKSDFLLRLAEILESNNLQNVQALTHARVPIVKLKDPVTGISCDICMNNVLAVVNTKLLRDYAQIDVRLRQLAFLVKHWAKSRGVNETYHGTLSSYAYVLMCIHFLQQRKPAVLPCLQGMETTYAVTANDVKCAYYDQVEKLYGYGYRNKENIAQLLWGFFNYWAYCHDYANNAISVRTGTIISKQSKDWTTRVGNDRHLICIEDPFQTSHDLGRVVDKFSIKVVREEFERAAHILQYDPNPCVKLFEPYVPERDDF